MSALLPSDEEVQRIIASIDPNTFRHQREVGDLYGWAERTRAALIAAWNRRTAPVGDDDWRDDPSADERWTAGCDFAMERLCAVLGIDPKAVVWDAATETLDGDVASIIGNILTTKFGEDWPATPTAPSREDVARVIRGVYGVGVGVYAGGYQDKDIERAAAAILSLLGQTGDGDAS